MFSNSYTFQKTQLQLFGTYKVTKNSLELKEESKRGDEMLLKVDQKKSYIKSFSLCQVECPEASGGTRTCYIQVTSRLRSRRQYDLFLTI